MWIHQSDEPAPIAPNDSWIEVALTAHLIGPIQYWTVTSDFLPPFAATLPLSLASCELLLLPRRWSTARTRRLRAAIG